MAMRGGGGDSFNLVLLASAVVVLTSPALALISLWPGFMLLLSFADRTADSCPRENVLNRLDLAAFRVYIAAPSGLDTPNLFSATRSDNLSRVV